MNQKKSVYFGKSADDKHDDGLNWCVASSDSTDLENDIVDIDTIQLKRHTKDHPIPVLSSHLKKLPDGSFPILGEVVEWVKGKDGDKNVLYAGWKWTDANPTLVDKVKPLFPRLVNNFSISFIPDSNEVYRENPAMGEDSPKRYKNVNVTELSLVLIGANENAVSLKEIKKSLGDILENDMKKDMDDSMNMSLSKKDMDEMMMSYTKSTNDLYTNQMQEMTTKNVDCINNCFKEFSKSLNDRFDALESQIADMSAEQTPEGGLIKTNKAEVAKELSDLKFALENMGKKIKSTW